MADVRVAIVQDYLPNYRVPFFDQLVGQLAEAGIDCLVIAGDPPGINATRKDATRVASWLRRVPNPREVRLWRERPRLFGYGSDRHWRDFDGVIMGLRGASLDLTSELLRRRWTGRRVGVWGHISESVNPPNAVDLAIERWQMRSSDHVFAYTQRGAAAAIANGVNSELVTPVMNSVDVSELIAEYRSLTSQEAAAFSRSHSLKPGKIFGFIGGVDAPKRIGFLSEVLDRLWAIDSEIKFLVAGKGNQEHLLKDAVGRGQVIMVGYGGPAEKAMICRVSQALVIPGRIGLLAVEALAIGIPILTTHWDYHAPEVYYLEPGIDLFESADHPSSLASLVISHVSEDGEVQVHDSRPYPTVENMVRSFSSGVEEMMR